MMEGAECSVFGVVLLWLLIFGPNQTYEEHFNHQGHSLMHIISRICLQLMVSRRFLQPVSEQRLLIYNYQGFQENLEVD